MKHKRQTVTARSFEMRHVRTLREGDVVCFDDGFIGTFVLFNGKPVAQSRGRVRKITADEMLVQI